MSTKRSWACLLRAYRHWSRVQHVYYYLTLDYRQFVRCKQDVRTILITGDLEMALGLVRYSHTVMYTVHHLPPGQVFVLEVFVSGLSLLMWETEESLSPGGVGTNFLERMSKITRMGQWNMWWCFPSSTLTSGSWPFDGKESWREGNLIFSNKRRTRIVIRIGKTINLTTYQAYIKDQTHTRHIYTKTLLYTAIHISINWQPDDRSPFLCIWRSF